MKVQLPIYRDRTILKTGKYHISFSEVSVAIDCSYRHKLQYIDGYQGKDSEHSTYGRAIHDWSQKWLLDGKRSDYNILEEISLTEETVLKHFKALQFNPTANALAKDWINPITNIAQHLPSWLEEQYPGYQVVASELKLFEPIDGHTNRWFKGYVDCIIRIPKKSKKGSKSKNKTKEYTYVVIDWKTTSWGWDYKKRTDKKLHMQLALYKHFFSKQMNIPFEDIETAFVLLKRIPKDKFPCELLSVKITENFMSETLAKISSVIRMIEKGLYQKNKNSCRFCEFKQTPLCP